MVEKRLKKIFNNNNNNSENNTTTSSNRKTPHVKSIFNIVWSGHYMKETERKHRTILPCAIKFKGYNEVVFHIMVKFYDEDKTVHCQGVPLSHLSLDGTLGERKEDSNIQLYNIIFT